ncbi:MAG: 4-hydroxythreonine-4-phosphate dehydrogenase PdxA [Clostridiales Family XIII bacterium]|jgi:4-hydroxythreonine-4-phosphate dehydrogenase|nr:4-hydroxythreonine-4-phosphate dehydrogenase PdxA [Clostridiales Family XIII bacterium]
MVEKKLPVAGITLGDHAGIGPEVVAKVLSAKPGEQGYVPVVFGDDTVFRAHMERYAAARVKDIRTADAGGAIDFTEKDAIYFVDVPLKEAVPPGEVSAVSGEQMIRMMETAIGYEKKGRIDGIAAASFTKQSLALADSAIPSEFELYDREYEAKGCDCVVVRGNIIRSTVTGHVALREIWDFLTTDAVVDNAMKLYEVMKRLGLQDGGMAVSGLNPHAGENGLFGDEEGRILEPAIEILRQRLGIQVIGPCPADTLFVRAMKGEVNGLVYLYHDQSNTAMKSVYFGEGNLIYINIPAWITSLGHGSALDIAGKGVADESNMRYALDLLTEMLRSDKDDFRATLG